jgi:NAD(P)-dependent dehydrogenase (short-subunit alcohol dehydrogenase family)
MDSLLSGKTAVVTGGSSGIGRGICLAMATHGADVVVADVRETPREGGTPTPELVETETDAHVRYVECDVTDVGDLETAVAAADAFGGIDVMVNDAAVGGEAPFEEVTEAEYDAMMAVNAKGVFFGSQVAAAAMDAGSIVNISSIAGLRGNGDLAVYSATKGAVRLLTYSLAEALAPDIRVNAIHPGAVETSMSTRDERLLTPETRGEYEAAIPRGRIGTPQDIGNAAVFLASDLADYVTAQSLVVDGGFVNTS